MTDRIEEIKAYSKKGIDYREDVPFLIGEIDRLKMMLDAAVAGKETMQRKMVERNENLRLDYLDAVAERDAAVNDCKGYCSTCAFAGDCSKHDRNDSGDADWYYGDCEHWEWRGVQK